MTIGGLSMKCMIHTKTRKRSNQPECDCPAYRFSIQVSVFLGCILLIICLKTNSTSNAISPLRRFSGQELLAKRGILDRNSSSESNHSAAMPYELVFRRCICWLSEQLLTILAALPQVVQRPAYLDRLRWEIWRDGLLHIGTLPLQLPPLRVLLIMDNLVGHKNPKWLVWCFHHGILPLYTPLGGSWLNMAETIQQLFKRRAINGQYPTSPQHIILALEDVAAHWNSQPTPFIWAGKRKP